MKELAEATVNRRPLFTVRAKVEVAAEVAPLVLAELTIEEKIDDAFYIITDHAGPS